MQELPSDRLANRSFTFFTLTQYLGAFNDNVFKQLILLLALLATAEDRQGLAMMVFSLPFLIFSGYAGQLSEIYSKTFVMRLAKIGELVIMLLGAIGFYLGNFQFLLVVLFLMGAQSTFFSPAKYGVIPELVSHRLLVPANGVIQMTTFLAIILGTALAGYLMTIFKSRLEIAGLSCIAIAILGILTVYLILPRPANRPEMALNLHPFRRLWASLVKMYGDKPLFLALIASTFFWFSGGLVIQVVNNYGIVLLGLETDKTSFLQVSIAVGIMIGCLAAGAVQSRIGGKWTIFTGAIGVAISEAALYFYQLPLGAIHGLLLTAGAFTGLYYVPLAAFMQGRPPLGEKGEVLAAMNFCSYIGLILSGALWMLWTQMGFSANYAWLMLSLSLVGLVAFMFPQLNTIE